MTLNQTCEAIREDLRRNIYPKSYVILVLYRLSHFAVTGSKLRLLLLSPLVVIYLGLVKWILGVEIPPKTQIGKGFVIYHGFGLVINAESQIGSHVIVRQGCCIGNNVTSDGRKTAAPIVGSGVELGVNALILGPVTVGDNARIGAGAVVVKDCDPDTTYVGVPAKALA